MADTAITGYPAATALAASDLFEVVTDVAGTPTNKKVAASLLFGGFAIATGTDADTTMAVNTLYVVDMSAWATADRTYTLPATFALGDWVGIMITAGDATHELKYTANTGDTLDAVAGGTERSRLFITSEVVIMRGVAANATWTTQHDGRKPMQALMRLSTAADGETAATFTIPTSAGGVWTADIDVGGITVVASSRVNARRACNFRATLRAVHKDAITSGQYFGAVLSKSAAADTVLSGHSTAPASSTVDRVSDSDLVPMGVDDYLVFRYRSQVGGLGCQSTFNATTFSVVEELI